MFYHMSAQTLKTSMFSLVLIASVCVCTYVSHLPSASSRHLPLLLRGGKVHLLQVRERERERHAYGRERIMHTHKEGGGEEE